MRRDRAARIRGVVPPDTVIIRCGPAAAVLLGAVAGDIPLIVGLPVALVLSVLFLGPLFVPVVVRDRQVCFWSVWRYVRITAERAAFTFATPLNSAGSDAGRSILVVVDTEVGKGFRVASAIANTREAMCEDMICPLAAALDRGSPALLRIAHLRSGAKSASLLLGGPISMGHVFHMRIRRRWFRYRVKPFESQVLRLFSIPGEDDRVVGVELKMDASPFHDILL
jgi:hypothetical protein